MNERTNRIIEDGETLHVPMLMMDGLQRAVATRSDKSEPRSNYIDELTSAWKSDESAIATDAEHKPAASTDAYLAYVQRTADAWKGS